MRVHHLNCGSMCPVGMRGTRSPEAGDHRPKLVCHCLAVETSKGIVLVDTGMGLGDVARHERLPLPMRLFLRTKLDPGETAVERLRGLGFSPSDVRHIVLTHLDFDHAGGIEDFPKAAVHVATAELAAAQAQKTLRDRLRYRPRQWNRHVTWRPFDGTGERWLGFDCIRDVPGLPPEILIVPLPGHSAGHCGVAVLTDSGWLLHAADAYFHHDEIHTPEGRCPAGLRGYQTFMELDRTARLHNRSRLRDLARTSPSVEIICSHDSGELERCQATRVRRASEATSQVSP